VIVTYVKITNGTANVWIQNSDDCGTATATCNETTECSTNEWLTHERELCRDDEADDPAEERAREPQQLPAESKSITTHRKPTQQVVRSPMHRLAWNTPPPVLAAGSPKVLPRTRRSADSFRGRMRPGLFFCSTETDDVHGGVMAKRQIKRCKHGDVIHVEEPSEIKVTKPKGKGWQPLLTITPIKTMDKTSKPKA